jgi:hypothetical protein
MALSTDDLRLIRLARRPAGARPVDPSKSLDRRGQGVVRPVNPHHNVSKYKSPVWC